jgi:alpha-L-arabinofuranosidase
MPTPRIEILLDESKGRIAPEIYGHFMEHLGACVYDGVWDCAQGRVIDGVVAALKEIRPTVIRWPGGCFADDYHWRDGVGPIAARPRRVNIHWGNVVESNAFGTHEFLALCRALGATPYLSGNVGSGSPAEMRDWVEYCNHPAGSTLSELRKSNGSESPLDVRLWGVGNENWGCGGHFTPEGYAEEYRRFATYLRDFGQSPLHLVACGPDGNDLDWTRRFFTRLMRDYRSFHRIHRYAAHYYCGTAGAGSATDFTDGEWYELIHKARRMEDLITQQRALMDEFDPERKIDLVVDEWGTWHFPTPGRNPAFLWQQNTLRDALVAALTLDTFNNHCDVVKMANIAQAVNVLQSLLLVEDGRVVKTPTWHVYDLYKNHQGADHVRVECDAPPLIFQFDGHMRRMPAVTGSASLHGRTLTLTLTNARIAEPVECELALRTGRAAIVRETVLTADDIQSHNTLARPDLVRPSAPRVIPASGDRFGYVLAPNSITRLEMSIV